MTPFLAHSTPFRSHRSLSKVSTNSGEAQPALHRLFKRRDGSFAKEMSTEPDIRSWPASQRSEHYQELATKLRRIAEAEKVPELRAQILALARQYQELVTGLRTKRS